MSDSGRKKAGISKVWSDFRSAVPFLKKKEAAWDDGTDAPVASEFSGGGFIYLIMAIVGFLEGFFGCQYGKYLHQRFNCLAWGIPLTSTPVKSYGVATVVIDVVMILVLAAILLAFLVLINVIIKLICKNRLDMCDEICNVGLMTGLLMMVVITLIMLFVPFNVFLLGVPAIR